MVAACGGGDRTPHMVIMLVSLFPPACLAAVYAPRLLGAVATGESAHVRMGLQLCALATLEPLLLLARGHAKV